MGFVQYSVVKTKIPTAKIRDENIGKCHVSWNVPGFNFSTSPPKKTLKNVDNHHYAHTQPLPLLGGTLSSGRVPSSVVPDGPRPSHRKPRGTDSFGKFRSHGWECGGHVDYGCLWFPVHSRCRGAGMDVNAGDVVYRGGENWYFSGVKNADDNVGKDSFAFGSSRSLIAVLWREERFLVISWFLIVLQFFYCSALFSIVTWQ